MAGETVFLDPTTNEVIVLPDGMAGATNGKPLRFQLHNEAIVNVSAAVSLAKDGRYQYDYTVVTAPGSPKLLQRWSLLVSSDVETLVQVGGNWRAENQATQMTDKAIAGRSPLHFIEVSPASAAASAPTASDLEIQLTSTYLPGYVTSFVRSASPNDIAADVLQGLPAATVAKIQMIRQPHWDARTIVVPGPRYPPGSPTLLVVSSLHRSIQPLVLRRKLDANSQFVKRAQAALKAALESGQERGFTEAELAFLPEAESSEETTLSNVLEVTLSRLAQ